MATALNLPQGFVLDEDAAPVGGLPQGFVLDEEAIAPMAAQQPETTFDRRKREVQDIMQKSVSGEINPFVGGVGIIGKSAGFVGEKALEPVMAAAKGAYRMMSPQQQKALSLVGKNYIAPAAEKFTELHTEAEQAAPQTTLLADAAANILGLGIGSAAVPVKPAVKGLANIASKIDPLAAIDRAGQKIVTPKVAKATINETALAKKDAGTSFDKLREENLIIEPENLKSLNRGLASLEPAGIDEKKIWGKSRAAKHVQEMQESMGEGAYVFNDAIARRQAIVSDIKKAYKTADGLGENDARQLIQVRDKIDDVIGEKIAPINLKWRKAAINQDLDQMVDFALGKQQPANTFNTQINNYIRKKGRTLPENIRVALKDLAKDSKGMKLTKAIASGLTKYALMAKGGPVGFFAGHYAAEASKDAAMWIKLHKLDEIRDMIEAMELPAKKGPWEKVKK